MEARGYDLDQLPRALLLMARGIVNDDVTAGASSGTGTLATSVPTAPITKWGVTISCVIEPMMKLR